MIMKINCIYTLDIYVCVDNSFNAAVESLTNNDNTWHLMLMKCHKTAVQNYSKIQNPPIYIPYNNGQIELMENIPYNGTGDLAK